MNDLVSFYLDEGCDSEGRTLAQIWEMSDEALMETHDVIQWLFPLTDPSEFNPNAPILTDRQIDQFREDPRLQRNLLKSFQRFMQVFGLTYARDFVVQVAHRDIWMRPNHNWLRFTRILKSLTLLGHADAAMAFFKFLDRKIGNADSMVYGRASGGWPPNMI